MKKLFALLLCLVLMVPALALAETEITLWTYPIGSWSKSDAVDEIVANRLSGHQGQGRVPGLHLR